MLILNLLFERCEYEQLLRLKALADDQWSKFSGSLVPAKTEDGAETKKIKLTSAIDRMLSGEDVAFLGTGLFADTIYAQCKEVIPFEWLSEWGGVSPDFYKRLDQHSGLLVCDRGKWLGLGRDLTTIEAELTVSLLGHFQPPGEALVGDCPFAKRLSTIPFLEMVREAMGEPGTILVHIN